MLHYRFLLDDMYCRIDEDVLCVGYTVKGFSYKIYIFEQTIFMIDDINAK